MSRQHRQCLYQTGNRAGGLTESGGPQGRRAEAEGPAKGGQVSGQASSVVGLLQEAVAASAQTRPAGESLLVGLIGRGIQSSRSPAMHEREATRLGIGCSYILLDFDRLDLPDEALHAVVAAAPQLGFRGFNVTHPFKQQIVPLLDALSPAAAAIGAVNTEIGTAHVRTPVTNAP